ncbi:hypothetical protein [Sinorhizobium meliloti]|uniref:hypothetical protein n=1 Tax=Rhizobium meliloti TaxID=382 RepID=UPI001F3A1BA9|nr:hypothetical protein [Sinorhizobium meliloti]
MLHAGLVSAHYITVDDTGARHQRDNCHTTQIGAEHFTVFRTTASKSRLNFLSLLRGSYQDYVLNDAAFDYLDDRRADPAPVANSATTNRDAFATRYRSSNTWPARASTSSTGRRWACSRKQASGDPFAITVFSAAR